MNEAKQIVERGYDRIAEQYAAWAGEVWEGARERYGSLLFAHLPEGAAVLDLGCSTGVPSTRTLATRFAVTGVDISGHSIELARQNVPNATFLHADLASVQFPPASFDAVVAFFSLIHVPRQEHAAVLRSIAAWLRPGGLLIATMGAGAADDDYEEDWLGAPMYWSHFETETNVRLVAEVGLEVIEANEETEDEEGVPVTHLWVVARKPV